MGEGRREEGKGEEDGKSRKRESMAEVARGRECGKKEREIGKLFSTPSAAPPSLPWGCRRFLSPASQSSCAAAAAGPMEASCSRAALLLFGRCRHHHRPALLQMPPLLRRRRRCRRRRSLSLPSRLLLLLLPCSPSPETPRAQRAWRQLRGGTWEASACPLRRRRRLRSAWSERTNEGSLLSLVEERSEKSEEQVCPLSH